MAEVELDRALVHLLGTAPEGVALRSLLRTEIARHLDTERARLMAILYRVDVREKDLNAALAQDDVPGALADALIARMTEKRQYRR